MNGKGTFNTMVFLFQDHSRFVTCVRFSPDGSKMATVGLDKKGFIYDGKTGEKLAELTVRLE